MPKKNAAAVALGRKGGTANTPAQNAARARNAQRAGRPRRVCTFCGEPVIGGHVDRRLDDEHLCGQHGWRWQQGQSTSPAPTDARVALDAIAAQLQGPGLARDHVRNITAILRAAGVL